jgi:hypothetical protein
MGFSLPMDNFEKYECKIKTVAKQLPKYSGSTSWNNSF